MEQPISVQEVRRAATELAKMRGSLTSWLRYRTLNDRVLAGTTPTTKPLGYAQRLVAGNRDMAAEQDLADKLSALLHKLLPGQTLPNADLRTNPQGAVQLAQIALMGASQVPGPVATGALLPSMGSPWVWPAIIVGAVLVTVTTAIKTAADVAKDHEEKMCIQAGACTDYGFWLKAAGVAALLWLGWEKWGGKEFFKKGRA